MEGRGGVTLIEHDDVFQRHIPEFFGEEAVAGLLHIRPQLFAGEHRLF